MRPVLHLLSVILVLPVVALAAAFVILGRAIARGSLPGLLLQLVDDALWLMPWGLLAGAAAILAIALAGFFTRVRWLAGACVAALGVASAAVVIALGADRLSASLNDWLFFVPGIAAVAIGTWLALTEGARACR